MKIHKVIFAAIICSCVQTADTRHDEDFIDPTDMEHYDQPTKSLKVTLKERESFKIFKGLLQRLLENAEKSGLADEENHYDAQVILTREAHAEISDFLQDKPCNPEVIKEHLNRILINFKKHNEDEWKLKFEEFFQMEITKVEKLKTTEEMLKKHFKKILEKVKNSSQRADVEGKANDVEVEIKKFLSDEDWDQEKLEIILENFPLKEEGISFLMYFWSLVLIFVTSSAINWIIRFYSEETAQIVEENREEEDDGYHEDPMCAPIPETRENKVIPDIRGANQNESSAERDRVDDRTSQSFKKSHTLTREEHEDRSHEQDGVLTKQARLADNLLKNRESADVSKAEEPKTEPARSEMRREPGALEDYCDELNNTLLNEIQESLEQAYGCEEVKQSSASPTVVESKDDESVEGNQTFSHALLHEDEREEDAAVLQDDATESDRSDRSDKSDRRDIQTGPGSLQDEDLYSDMSILNLPQIDDQERQSLSEEQQRCHMSPNVVDVTDQNSQALLHGDERGEDAAVLQDDAAVLQTDAAESDRSDRSDRSDIQTGPGSLRDEDLYSDMFLLNLPQTDNQVSLSNEKEQVGAEPDAKGSTDSTDCNQDPLSCNTEEASGEKVIVGAASDPHHLQDTSMNEDEESDFIVINESLPFVQDEDHEKSAGSV